VFVLPSLRLFAWVQARGTCDARVLELGSENFARVREVASVLPAADGLLEQIGVAERFLKYEYKAHVNEVCEALLLAVIVEFSERCLTEPTGLAARVWR